MTGRKPTTGCQRDQHPSNRTDSTSHLLARNAAPQSGKQHVLTSNETYRTALTPHATCRVGVPTARRGKHRDDRSTLRSRRSWMSEDEKLNIWRLFAPVGQHNLATWLSTQTVVSLSSAESEYYSTVRCA